MLHSARWEKFLATLRKALRKVELTSTFRNKKIATNVCYTRQYFVQRIMFTVGNVDRYIDRYIGRHSIDIAVPSRSTVDRLAIDSRSTLDRLWSRGGQQSIDCRSRGGRQSIDCRTPRDRVSNDIAVDAPRPNIGHMSVAYRSTVGDTSVNCWWHISQLSVAYRSTVGGISVNCRSQYQSCVNLADKSNGFPFERLSNVIMLLGKMLHCEGRLLYKAKRRALRTMVEYGHGNLFFFQFVSSPIV